MKGLMNGLNRKKTACAIEESISGHGGDFKQIDPLNLTLTHSTYDGAYEYNDEYYEYGEDGFIAVGHTWKPYYFYWDEQDGEFKEYGGVFITEAELAKYSGAKEVLGEIREGGYEITGIIYRGNGIVNINYRLYSEERVGDRNVGWSDNNNATLLIEDEKAVLLPAVGWHDEEDGCAPLEHSSYGGVYLTALISDGEPSR